MQPLRIKIAQVFPTYPPLQQDLLLCILPLSFDGFLGSIRALRRCRTHVPMAVRKAQVNTEGLILYKNQAFNRYDTTGSDS